MEEVRGLEPPVGEWGGLLEERTAMGQGLLARRKLHQAVRSRKSQCDGSTLQGTGREGGSGES